MSIGATEKTGAIVPFVTSASRSESRKDHQELLALYEERWPALRRFGSASREMIAELQLRRLVRLVDYAARTVPFYARLYRGVGYKRGDLRSFEDFARLPIVERSTLSAAWSEERRKNVLLARRQPAAFQTASPGLDGRFVTVARDRRAVMIEALMALRQLEHQSQGQLGDRDLLLEIGAAPPWFSSVAGLYRRTFLSSQAELDDLAGAIRALRPAAVALAPSLLTALLPRLGDLRDHDVEVVIVRDERSTRKERQVWSDAVRVKVLDEYAPPELGRLAVECPYGRHHLEDDATYVEVLAPEPTTVRAEREAGELVVTSLLNQAMPLIRCRSGDRARFAGSRCACGSGFRTIDSPEGPSLDSFPLPHGRLVSAGQLRDALAGLRLHLGIPTHGAAYRLVQEALDRVVLRFQPGPGFSEDMVPAMREALEKALGPAVRVEVALGRLPDRLPGERVISTQLTPGARGAREG